MADFTKLNLNGSEYSVKDEVARNFLNVMTINSLKKSLYNKFSIFQSPFELPEFLKQFLIYQSNDKQNYKIIYDKEKFISKGEKEYFVSVLGNNQNDGLTKETAWRTISHAITNAEDSSTIYVDDGYYFTTDMPIGTQYISKNINIIGGKETYFLAANLLDWTKVEAYTNVYTSVRSNIKRVIDMRGREKNSFLEFNRVDSIEEVARTIGSFYTDGTNVYVNNGEEVNSENTILTLSNGYHTLQIKPETQNINVYLENIKIFGSNCGSLYISNNNSYIPTVYCKNCKFLFSGGSGDFRNGVNVLGSNSIFESCEVNFSDKDGINYTAVNNISSNGVEVDCICSNNGNTDNSNNGSTAHLGCKVIRINGNYFNNKGINVADTHENTKSININCNAFDSLSSETTAKYDFASLNSGSAMYLYNCFSKGSNSDCNLLAYSDSYLYHSNCEYDTTGGPGTVTELV